jgi:hypothetical protein
MAQYVTIISFTIIIILLYRNMTFIYFQCRGELMCFTSTVEYCGGVRLIPLGRTNTSWPILQPRIVDEYVTFGEKRIIKGKRHTLRISATVPLCPFQTTHNMNLGYAPLVTVENWWIRPNDERNSWHLSGKETQKRNKHQVSSYMCSVSQIWFCFEYRSGHFSYHSERLRK